MNIYSGLAPLWLSNIFIYIQCKWWWRW